MHLGMDLPIKIAIQISALFQSKILSNPPLRTSVNCTRAELFSCVHSKLIPLLLDLIMQNPSIFYKTLSHKLR